MNPDAPDKSFVGHFSARSFAVALLQILGFAGLTALCSKAQFYLPFTVVPITLQSFAVVLAGALLGPEKGALSQMALIGSGMGGLPVFTPHGPGFLGFFGPTGGYILGFVLAAYVTGVLFQRLRPRGFFSTSVLLFIASLFIFIPGVLWLKVYTGNHLSAALQQGFFPFIPGDILKSFMAAGVLMGLQKTKTLRRSE